MTVASRGFGSNVNKFICDTCKQEFLERPNANACCKDGIQLGGVYKSDIKVWIMKNGDEYKVVEISPDEWEPRLIGNTNSVKVAQSGEHRTRNSEDAGSNPVLSPNYNKELSDKQHAKLALVVDRKASLEYAKAELRILQDRIVSAREKAELGKVLLLEAEMDLRKLIMEDCVTSPIEAIKSTELPPVEIEDQLGRGE